MENSWFQIDLNVENNEVLKDILISDFFEIGAKGIEDLDNSFFYQDDEVNEEKGLRVFFADTDNQTIIVQKINDILKKYNLIDKVSIVKINLIPKENWREKWKENYHPIISEEFIVCPVWLKDDLELNTKYKDKKFIYIEPKMAFGTGTHETTKLMLKLISISDLKDKYIMDAGTGSGILTIACAKKEAILLDAFDIEQESIDNTKENLIHNDIDKQKITIELVNENTYNKTFYYDYLLSNINRTVLIELMKNFVKVLKDKGFLILSGILIEEKEKIIDCLNKLIKYEIIEYLEDGEWCAYKIKKVINL